MTSTEKICPFVLMSYNLQHTNTLKSIKTEEQKNKKAK